MGASKAILMKNSHFDRTLQYVRTVLKCPIDFYIEFIYHYTDTDPNTGKNRSSTIFRYCCEFRYLSRSWQTLIKPQKLKENTQTQEIPFQKF